MVDNEVVTRCSSRVIWVLETPGAAAPANEAAVVASRVHSASGCRRRQEQQHRQHMKRLSLPEKSTAHMGVGDAKSSSSSK